MQTGIVTHQRAYLVITNDLLSSLVAVNSPVRLYIIMRRRLKGTFKGELTVRLGSNWFSTRLDVFLAFNMLMHV